MFKVCFSRFGQHVAKHTIDGNIHVFHLDSVDFKVYTYFDKANRYYIRECIDNTFIHVSAGWLRENYPFTFSIIKDSIGTRKYKGV